MEFERESESSPAREHQVLPVSISGYKLRQPLHGESLALEVRSEWDTGVPLD